MLTTPITITTHPDLGHVVSGRELYGLVATTTASRDIFSDWFLSKRRMYNLEEGKDFVLTSVLLPNSGSNRKHIESIVTLKAAVAIANGQTRNQGAGVVAFIREFLNKPAEPVTAPLFSPELNVGASNGKNSAMPTIQFNAQPEPVLEPKTPELTPMQQLSQQVTKLASAEEDKPGKMEGIENRLALLEGKVNRILQMFHHLTSTTPPTTPSPLPAIPELKEVPTTRMKIVRMVDAYVAAKGLTHQNVWNYLYGQLAVRFKFDAWSLSVGKKDPNYLDTVEEGGQLDNLYAIAKEALQAEPVVA